MIQPRTEPLDDRHLADAAIGADDDFENDISLDTEPSGLLGVLRLDLTYQGGGRNAAAGPVRSTSRAAAFTLADPRTFAFTHSASLAGTRSATGTRSLTRGHGWRLLNDAGQIAWILRRRSDGCHHWWYG